MEQQFNIKTYVDAYLQQHPSQTINSLADKCVEKAGTAGDGKTTFRNLLIGQSDKYTEERLKVIGEVIGVDLVTLWQKAEAGKNLMTLISDHPTLLQSSMGAETSITNRAAEAPSAPADELQEKLKQKLRDDRERNTLITLREAELRLQSYLEQPMSQPMVLLTDDPYWVQWVILRTAPEAHDASEAPNAESMAMDPHTVLYDGLTASPMSPEAGQAISRAQEAMNLAMAQGHAKHIFLVIKTDSDQDVTTALQQLDSRAILFELNFTLRMLKDWATVVKGEGRLHRVIEQHLDAIETEEDRFNAAQEFRFISRCVNDMAELVGLEGEDLQAEIISRHLVLELFFFGTELKKVGIDISKCRNSIKLPIELTAEQEDYYREELEAVAAEGYPKGWDGTPHLTYLDAYCQLMPLIPRLQVATSESFSHEILSWLRRGDVKTLNVLKVENWTRWCWEQYQRQRSYLPEAAPQYAKAWELLCTEGFPPHWFLPKFEQQSYLELCSVYPEWYERVNGCPPADPMPFFRDKCCTVVLDRAGWLDKLNECWLSRNWDPLHIDFRKRRQFYSDKWPDVYPKPPYLLIEEELKESARRHSDASRLPDE